MDKTTGMLRVMGPGFRVVSDFGYALTNINHANAALIAKAPAMHTLLRQAVDQFIDDINNDEPINGADAVEWLVDFVERAQEVIDG